MHEPTQLDNEQMLDIFFNPEWDGSADEGICDARGGMEYQRVSQLWIREGCAVDGLRHFIRVECNLLRSRAEKGGGS